MKRILVISLVLLMLLSVTACGGLDVNSISNGELDKLQESLGIEKEDFEKAKMELEKGLEELELAKKELEDLNLGDINIEDINVEEVASEEMVDEYEGLQDLELLQAVKIEYPESAKVSKKYLIYDSNTFSSSVRYYKNNYYRDEYGEPGRMKYGVYNPEEKAYYSWNDYNEERRVTYNSDNDDLLSNFGDDNHFGQGDFYDLKASIIDVFGMDVLYVSFISIHGDEYVSEFFYSLETSIQLKAVSYNGDLVSRMTIVNEIDITSEVEDELFELPEGMEFEVYEYVGP